MGSEYISAEGMQNFSGTFYIILGKDVSQGKKLGELRNESSKMFGETSPNKLLLLPKKIIYIISLKVVSATFVLVYF